MSVVGAYIVPHPPLIVPDIGQGRESGINATIKSYEKAAEEIAELSPDTIVVISPHSIVYSDYIHISPGAQAYGDFSQFGCKNLRIEAEYDTELVRAIEEEANRAGVYSGTAGEKNQKLDHGTLVPLYFVNKYFKKYRLVRVSISGHYYSDLYKFGIAVRDSAERLGRRIVIIASGDLSHKLSYDGPYGFSEEGPEFDRQVTESMKSAAFLDFMTYNRELCENAAECGLRSFVIMAGAFDETSVRADFMSYEGPFGVGYAVCGYMPGERDESRDFLSQLEEHDRKEIEEKRKNQDKYVNLAQFSLENYFNGGGAKIPEGMIDDSMLGKAGVFVCLKKHGELRGCIGTIFPAQKTIAEEILANAISAATKDERFEPVNKEELKDLAYTVDILGEPEKCSWMDLDPKRYGVIVTSGYKRAVLLPDLDGIDTVEKQLEVALRKGGIKQSEDYKTERFTVERHI